MRDVLQAVNLEFISSLKQIGEPRLDTVSHLQDCVKPGIKYN